MRCMSISSHAERRRGERQLDRAGRGRARAVVSRAHGQARRVRREERGRVGRLATDADRARVVEALGAGNEQSGETGAENLDATLKALVPRWFVLRNVHQTPSLALLQSRTTLCWLKGPMTRQDLKRALAAERARDGAGT